MSLRVLVAEDNEFASLQYKKVFEKHQHKLTVARDGQDCVFQYAKALENFGKDMTPFDVVLLDFVMPKKNGVNVAKEILDLRPKQKIIFVSAYGAGILEDAAVLLKDSVEIIQKPFSLEFLVNKIENYFLVKST